MEFESYFDDHHIIDLLCKYRAEWAQRRHDYVFFRNLSSCAKNPCEVDFPHQYLFPPRRSWIRPNQVGRRNRSALEINTLALKRTIELNLRSISSSSSWLSKLRLFIEGIKSNAIYNFCYKVPEPDIFPQLKDKVKKTYRPIALYELKDRIILSLTAKYIREVIDKYFLRYSFAFRAPSEMNHITPTYHSAVESILQYLNRFEGKKLYVAECDIQKFYDTVHHNIALEGLWNAILRLGNEDRLDVRAILIFKSYLDSYTFKKTALTKGEKKLLSEGKDGIIPWVKENELKKRYGHYKKERIGIPQGGALSIVIANLVLDAADREIDKIKDQDLFYARYCDDMIMIHTDKKRCEEAFETYCNSLDKLNLIIHEPKEVDEYNDKFYDLKSKMPYLWTEPKGRKDAVPWISFVGYQIRYDGLIRVRETSIKKELEKQLKITDRVIRMMNDKQQRLRKSSKQIIVSHTNKLISMSVGRRNLFTPTQSGSQFCWCSGFKLLRSNKCVMSQLKRLDRNRTKQLYRVKKLARKLNIKPINPHNRKLRLPRYYGAPFSYYSQFRKS